MNPKILFGFCGIVLAIAGFFVAQEFRARSWEARWDGFHTRWKAEGEVFDLEKHMPPDIGEDSDFAKHPLIRRIAESESGVLQALEKMKPDRVEGYEDWESDTPLFPCLRSGHQLLQQPSSQKQFPSNNSWQSGPESYARGE